MLNALVAVFSAVMMMAGSVGADNNSSSEASVGVGFGTAALGSDCYQVVLMALEAGFRKFDTAEADWWYDQRAVGRALQDFIMLRKNNPEEESSCRRTVDGSSNVCEAFACEHLRISTKIPPWSLTSEENIRSNAASSRQELLGFCDVMEPQTAASGSAAPLDVYYIHAPTCWKGWHPRCDNHPPLLDLRSSWCAMEAVVGLDGNARRIGLSNIRPDELLDIIHYVQERQQSDPQKDGAPPRIPDVVQAFADPIEPAEELRRICREHGIEFVSYSTLGTQHRSVSQNPVLGSTVVQQLAAKHGRSTAEVVLSWALQQGMSVIPRSGNKGHIQELARLLREDPTFLAGEDLAEIDAMKYTL